MDKIFRNGQNIIGTISSIKQKYDKIVHKLNKKQLKSLMPTLLKSIKEIPFDEMNTDSINKIFHINLINQENSISSPSFPSPGSNGRHLSITPSKFQRNSEEERNSLLRQIEKLDTSQQLNYVSSIRKVNNFFENSNGSQTPKIVKNFLNRHEKNRVNSEKLKSSYSKNLEEIEKRIHQKRTLLLEKRRNNEERSATLIESCKSSEHRLLSSLSRNNENK